MQRHKLSRLGIITAVLLLSPTALAQKQGAFRIDYTVKVASIKAQLFHVTAEVKHINQPRLELSLPTWTPGWYTVENYFRNVLRFKVTNARGKRIEPQMTRKQTWRIDTASLNSIKVEFDYHASVLALNQAKIADDFAFFTGTELFLEAAGHRTSPSSVRFEIPPDWKIISALDETSDPMVFTAPDYDTLVDCPTEMGKFDVAEFKVEGKSHYLVSTPAGALPQYSAGKFTEMLAKVGAAQSAIFGGLPYKKYTYFYFFSRPESNAGGALEHLSSHVAFAYSPNPEYLIGTASHEFFHAWNVKRVRPAGMWPYDYSRENETPLLWVSEGFTNYYGNLSLYRARLRSKQEFLESVQGAIEDVETNEARSYISPANSSVSTWVGYDTAVAFGISYYTQGQNLAALLDLSILHDTGGAFGLDAVMRALYREFYQRGNGFTTEQMIGIVNRLTKRDYHDFYRKYVSGVEVPPYNKILGYAGFRVDSFSRKAPLLGFGFDGSSDGWKVTEVVRGGPASRAGVLSGDVVLSIDGIDAKKGYNQVKEILSNRIGSIVKLVIKRAGTEQTLDLEVGSRDETRYKLVDIPGPTAEQLKIREAWLSVGK